MGETATLTVGTNASSTWTSGVTFDLPDEAPITLSFSSISGDSLPNKMTTPVPGALNENTFIAAGAGRIAPYIRFQEDEYDSYLDLSFSISAVSPAQTITSLDSIALTLNSITSAGGNHTQGLGKMTLTLLSSDALTSYGSGTATLGTNSTAGTATITLADSIDLTETKQNYILRITRTEGYAGKQGFVAIEGGSIGYSISASPNVPEPTTATLSLLALAGLAARRRRK